MLYELAPITPDEYSRALIEMKAFGKAKMDDDKVLCTIDRMLKQSPIATVRKSY